MDIHRLVGAAQRLLPDLSEELAAGHDLTGAAGQMGEQVELPGREVEREAIEGDLTGGRVHDESTHPQRLFRLGLAQAPQHRLDPRVELGRPERLHDVVVGAALQQRDHLRLLVPRGRHDHRYVADGPQHPQHLPAVHVRQPQVQHDQVRRTGHGRVEPCHAAGRCRDRVTFVPQSTHECAAQSGVVLHNQQVSHDDTVATGLMQGVLRVK